MTPEEIRAVPVPSFAAKMQIELAAQIAELSQHISELIKHNQAILHALVAAKTESTEPLKKTERTPLKQA